MICIIISTAKDPRTASFLNVCVGNISLTVIRWYRYIIQRIICYIALNRSTFAKQNSDNFS